MKKNIKKVAPNNLLCRSFNRTDKKGFTLVELLLVVAIIGILSGIVLLSLVGQRRRAKDTQIFAEISATIQPMLMCSSDGGVINIPANGIDICDISSAYGAWPDYSSTSYLYSSGNSSSFNKDIPVPDKWHINILGEINDVCCNELSKKCAKVGKGAGTCTNGTQL